MSQGPSSARVRLRRVAAGLLLSGLVAACRTPMPIEVVPAGTPLAADDERVERLLADYHDGLADRRGLHGSARVALVGPDVRLSRPQRIAAERPDRLRFEILGLFDQLAAILVTDGARYGYYDASTGRVSRGRVTPTLLRDLTQIDLVPEEVVGILLASPTHELGMRPAGAWLEPSGRVAIAYAWPDEDAALACERSDCRLTERALVATGGQLFFFGPSGRLVEFRALDPGAEIRYRVHFEAYGPVGDGVDFPKRVTLESPQQGSEARFDWKRVVLAGELSDRLFTLPEVGRSGRGG